MDALHVVVHVTLGDRPLTVRTQDLLAFQQFSASALVVLWEPVVTHWAELVVLALVCMTLVTPFAASGALHTFRAVSLQELVRSVGLATVGTGVLEMIYINIKRPVCVIDEVPYLG